jgi:hypothetical protein
MNIKEALLDEHSKDQCSRIAKFIGQDKERFAELMRLFFEGEYRVTQRAAWPMSYCVRDYPDLVKPYFGRLLNNLKKPGLHDSIPRNTLRLLQHVSIPKKFHGQLMSTCFHFVEKPETATAIKAFSLNILFNFTTQYPAIVPELKLLVADQWENETAAFRSSGRKILELD